MADERGSRLWGFGVGLCAGLLFKDLGLRAVVSYWGPVGPLVALSAIVGAALWTTRARRVLVAGCAALAVAWLLVGFTPIARWLVRPLVRADAVGPADAIFVLSSNVQSDDEPSPAALARATRGLELLGRGLAPRLYLSELGPPAGSYVRYLRDSAAKMGCPHPDAIESVGRVRTTWDEALRTAELFRARGWRRLLLVTSPTHTRRAAAAFERAGVPEVIAVPSVETQVDLEHLRWSDERHYVFGQAMHEWIGMLVYRLRGRI